jgi:hypothetical protein
VKKLIALLVILLVVFVVVARGEGIVVVVRA